MTAQIKKLTKQYLKQTKNLFPMYRKKERLFMSQLKNAVEDFVEDNPCCTFDDILQRFEDPQTIVYNYLSALDPAELYKKISLRRYIQKGFVILLLLATIFTTYKMVLFYDAYLDAKSSIIYSEETIIE